MFGLKILKSTGSLGTEAPKWFRVIPAGTVEIEDDEPAVMDGEGAALIIDHFSSLKHDMVVDYEHQTLTGEEAPAAGWVRELEWREGDGLWAKTEWTEKAKGYIGRREYRYHSPVFFIRKRDRKIIGLYNVALTNQPRMKNVSALVAKYEPEETEESEMFEKLCELLGLTPEDVTEEDVIAAVEKLLSDQEAGEEPPVAAKAVLDALGLKDGDAEAVVVAKIEALKAPASAAGNMSAELVTLKSELSDLKAAKLTDAAVADGQITPDEMAKWGNDLAKSNPEQFRLIVLSRPRGSAVPVDPLPGKKEGAAPDDPTQDEAVMKVAKQMGVSAEDLKNYGGK